MDHEQTKSTTRIDIKKNLNLFYKMILRTLKHSLSLMQTSHFMFLFTSVETLVSRDGHIKANGKPRFAVGDFTLAVCRYAGFKICGR